MHILANREAGDDATNVAIGLDVHRVRVALDAVLVALRRRELQLRRVVLRRLVYETRQQDE